MTTEEKLGAARDYIDQLERENESLRIEKFGLERFSTDDSMITFHTGFRSYNDFVLFFNSVQPTAVSMVRWSKDQTILGSIIEQGE